jgi:hypothetical protein
MRTRKDTQMAFQRLGFGDSQAPFRECTEEAMAIGSVIARGVIAGGQVGAGGF